MPKNYIVNCDMIWFFLFTCCYCEIPTCITTTGITAGKMSFFYCLLFQIWQQQKIEVRMLYLSIISNDFKLHFYPVTMNIARKNPPAACDRCLIWEPLAWIGHNEIHPSIAQHVNVWPWGCITGDFTNPSDATSNHEGIMSCQLKSNIHVCFILGMMSS